MNCIYCFQPMEDITSEQFVASSCGYCGFSAFYTASSYGANALYYRDHTIRPTIEIARFNIGTAPRSRIISPSFANHHILNYYMSDERLRHLINNPSLLVLL